MSREKLIVSINDIKDMILTIRGIQVMIDRDVAAAYQVDTKVLNQAVKRNQERFPNEFRFQLNDAEKYKLVTNCDRLAPLKYSPVNPHAFTEQGISMLSAILRSETAVRISIQIINAFVEMRHFLQNNAYVFTRLNSIEQRQLAFEFKTEKNFKEIFKSLRSSELPKQGIFYNGQVFDAHIFVSNLMRKAKKALVLIDNYIDDSVLTLLSKRADNVSATIYTKIISKQLSLDIKKHNRQYQPIRVIQFNDAHDRFIIIDEKDIYHFGASLKDLGKKWFAFSKFESGAMEMLIKLKAKK